MKRFFTFTLSLLLPALLLAQSKVILNPGGSIAGPANEVLKIRTAINADRGFSKIISYDQSLDGLNGTIDTINWAPHSAFTVNFGFFGQDYMVQWFEAPTEMNINAVSVLTSDDENPNVSVKLVSMAWDRDQIQATQTLGASWWGYYEATGNGYNDIGGFEEDSDVTGAWVEKGEGETQQWGSPFGADLWSDLGEGAPITVVTDQETWVSMDLLGFSPSVVTGELFAVVTKNDGATMDAGRTGWYASNTLGITGFKMYRNGRLTAGVDFGWWTRLYSWDFNVAVELTGDRAPVINSYDHLATTLSTDTRTVTANITDDNPSGGSAGVASATLSYTVDGGDTVSVAMTGTEPDFSADIPGQVPGSSVVYWIDAVDVNDLAATPTSPWSYNVFEPTQITLVVFNGLSGAGYPSAYYFGVDDFAAFSTFVFDHDVWAFGALTAELVNHYTNIIEITTSGPSAINNDVIRAWLEADASRNYMLAGDEWLGTQSGWVNGAHDDGSFHKDILGITFEYNDVNYAVAGDQNLHNQVLTVPGSDLGNTLDSLSKVVEADSAVFGVDTLWYDPAFEIGVTNWMDGVDVTDDSDVFLQGVGADDNTYNIGVSRTLAAGNKIAYFAYDPLSINSSPYYWFGFSESAPQVEALKWFGADGLTAIGDELGSVAREFELKQNYPNPFNPSTSISYVLPTAAKVELKVFDLLGREVASLVNQKQVAGSHTTTFNATNLSSGMYVYTLKAGSFNSTRKMLLVK